MSKAECGNCRFYNDDGDKFECRRYPPAFKGNEDEADFPEVFEDDWCGEHQYKQEPNYGRCCK